MELIVKDKSESVRISRYSYKSRNEGDICPMVRGGENRMEAICIWTKRQHLYYANVESKLEEIVKLGYLVSRKDLVCMRQRKCVI